MRNWLIILIFSFIFSGLQAQPWTYDFGTATGSHTSGESTTFLPDAPSGFDRVRIGTQGGSFNLENQDITFGSGSYLRAVAPTGGSVNKYSIYDYTVGKTFTFRFLIRFGASDGSSTGASSGTWYLFIGDGDIYSNNNSFSGAQVFLGLRWVFGAEGTITSHFRDGGSWTALSGTPFAQGVDYLIEIYGNNSTSSESYTYDTPQTLAVNTFDLWIDGILVGNDLSKAQLPDDSNIDSWMFYGESSTSNVANIFLDDFIWTNEIASEPLPVELTSFEAEYVNNSVQLNWETATEVNNFGFDIERQYQVSSSEYQEWERIGLVYGHGTTNSPKYYSYIDEDLPNADRLYYRLKQIDNDGTYAYSKTVEIDLSDLTSVNEENMQYEFALEQNYPNPFNPVTTINFTIPNVADANFTSTTNAVLKVYNLLGQEIRTLVNEVKQAGSYQIQFDASNLPSGIYFYSLTYGNNIQTRKLALLK